LSTRTDQYGSFGPILLQNPFGRMAVPHVLLF
jgi:hypothetical protein